MHQTYLAELSCSVPPNAQHRCGAKRRQLDAVVSQSHKPTVRFQSATYISMRSNSLASPTNGLGSVLVAILVVPLRRCSVRGEEAEVFAYWDDRAVIATGEASFLELADSNSVSAYPGQRSTVNLRAVADISVWIGR
jgi:hypothetical protein